MVNITKYVPDPRIAAQKLRRVGVGKVGGGFPYMGPKKSPIDDFFRSHTGFGYDSSSSPQASWTSLAPFIEASAGLGKNKADRSFAEWRYLDAVATEFRYRFGNDGSNVLGHSNEGISKALEKSIEDLNNITTERVLPGMSLIDIIHWDRQGRRGPIKSMGTPTSHGRQTVTAVGPDKFVYRGSIFLKRPNIPLSEARQLATRSWHLDLSDGKEKETGNGEKPRMILRIVRN
ncbi:hypothetical protein MKZ38_003357 [Zalerion maritima]|uniref:Uncharacterized protein n=1 Tax=Zalerion maritima TaxID=339359 RepID=A0AAD5WRW8_9PEZI|nr:hypothetical protein MKZ38_003357 [Zalerion maritima]